jgi:hypothetical protein
MLACSHATRRLFFLFFSICTSSSISCLLQFDKKEQKPFALNIIDPPISTFYSLSIFWVWAGPVKSLTLLGLKCMEFFLEKGLKK